MLFSILSPPPLWSPPYFPQGAGCLNIVPSIEIVLSWSHLCIVMELMGGGSLAEYITKRIPKYGGLVISEDEARYFFNQILDGMEYCHKRHVVHR